MRRPLPTAGRPISGLLLLALIAALVLAPARPAAAHGSLAMSTPASGATVAQPLTTVALYFTEKVASNAHLTITAPGGGRVDQGWSYGEPKRLDQPVREYVLVDGTFEPREYAMGFPAVVAVAHLPAAGEYSVSYLSVASDGEPVRGAMTFRYTGPVTAAPAGWSPPSDQPDPALVAAVEHHETSGHGSTAASAAAPAPPASPPAVAAPAAGDDGGTRLPVWAGGAAALAAMVAGLMVWRRRAPAGRSTDRSRTASRGRGAGSRTVRTASAGRTRRPGRGDADRRAPLPNPGPGPATEPGPAPDPAPGTSTTRLALLVGGLVVALLAGFGLGRTVDPPVTGVQAAGGKPGTGQVARASDGHQHPAGTGAHTHPDGGGAAQVGGMAVSAGGYTMEPVQRSQPAGVPVDYRFRIVGADGQTVTRFATVHDKPLHLVVVGRDLSGYQHLHPTMASDGTWSVPLKLPRAGGHRLYADFSVASADGTPLPLVLGVDHHVAGAYAPVALPPARQQATAGPFAVSMSGTPAVGVSVPVTFRVSRAGSPDAVPTQRYLGAYGHLVVVREGDLGYVHVHPEPQLVDGKVTFWLTAPSAGRYRAFFDFQVDGAVHTAEYTIDLAPA